MTKNKLQAERDEMIQQIVNSMSTLLSSNRLDEILNALSKGCMAHCRDMLNADMSKDNQGNTLRMLFDFSERIRRLADSAASHNEQAPKRSGAWESKDRVKMSRPMDRKPRYESDNPDDEIE